MKLGLELIELFATGYPCHAFSTVCKSMRWDPMNGHIPRGFVGAMGALSDVEVILVVAEPGDPQPGDHQTMEEAVTHAYYSYKSGTGVFHQKARAFLELCWPGLPFDEQMKRVWITESVLCSADRTTGPVPVAVENECGIRFLKKQLDLFPNALVVALGGKAQKRLARMGVQAFERAHAFGLPGCNQKEALASWVRVSQLLRGKRLEVPRICCARPIPTISIEPPVSEPGIDYSYTTGMASMTLTRKTLTREEAAEYTRGLERQAEAIGIDLDRWILAVGKPNNIRVGKGPRFAIVACAQENAAMGLTYGSVLGRTVIQGDGSKYKIRQHDLAGFVCANGYCTIVPPHS